MLPTLKCATQQHYKYTLKAHLFPAFGDCSLSDITREAIQSFLLAKLREEYSWESVHHFRCALSKVLGTAEDWNYIPNNPVRKTRLPKRDYNSEQPVVTPQHVTRLSMALSEPAKSIALLLVLTGSRIGERLALRWKNVNLDAQMLCVTQRVYDGHFDRPKTKRSVRAIPLCRRASHCAGEISCSATCDRRCRSTARNGPGAPRPRFTGDHEANLSARDPGGTAPSS